MEEANDPEACVHVFAQLKTDMWALDEMDCEKHFVMSRAVFVRVANLEK